MVDDLRVVRRLEGPHAHLRLDLSRASRSPIAVHTPTPSQCCWPPRRGRAMRLGAVRAAMSTPSHERPAVRPHDRNRHPTSPTAGGAPARQAKRAVAPVWPLRGRGAASHRAVAMGPPSATTAARQARPIVPGSGSAPVSPVGQKAS